MQICLQFSAGKSSDDLKNVEKKSVLRSRSRQSQNYLRPRAGNIFYISIFCSQFGGRKDEEKPPLRHISYGTTVIHSTVSGNI